MVLKRVVCGTMFGAWAGLLVLPTWAQPRNWEYEATAPVAITPGWMQDGNRIRVQDMVVDFGGNIFMTTGTGDNQAVTGGLTIFKPDGQGGWTITNVDLSQNGLNVPGGLTKLVVAGDGKVYALQNWLEINWDFPRNWNQKILRINLDGSVEVIYDATSHPQYGGIALFGDLTGPGPTYEDRDRDKIRGIAVGGDGHVYWTMNGAAGTWKYRLLWRYNVQNGQIEESPTSGTNNGWSQTHRIATDLHYAEDGSFVIVGDEWNPGTGADQMSWTQNRTVPPNSGLNPGWGVGRMVKTVYDPLFNKLWTGPRGSGGSTIMARANGAAGNTGLFTPNGIALGTCLDPTPLDAWHANGNDPGASGTSNGGAYWVAAMAINPADGFCWVSWGSAAAYNFNGTFGAVGPVYSMGPTDCSLQLNEGNPQTALNGNPSQTVALAFHLGRVYAETVDLTTGQFHLFSAEVPPPPIGACCTPDKQNPCVETTEAACVGSWRGDGTTCAAEEDTCWQHVCYAPAFDKDGDGDIDSVDFSVFQVCVTEDGIPIRDEPFKCSCFDNSDGEGGPPDGQVTFADDFGPFVLCGSGPDVPTPCN